MIKWLPVILGVLANASASALAKAGSSRPLMPLSVESAIAQWRLFLAVGLYGAAFVLYMLALSRLPLNVAHPVTTAGAIVLVGLISFIVFREPFTLVQGVGYGCLLLGIILISATQGAR